MFVGPDMCGKSEIARELSRQLEVPLFKASSEHDTFMNAQQRFIHQLQYADPRVLDFLVQTGYSVIFDRAYPCEEVYAKVFRRNTDHRVLVHLDREYAKLGARIVICHRSSYVGIKDDLNKDIDAKVLQDLDRGYVNFSAWTRCNVLHLNVDDENLEREVRDVKVWLETV